MDIDDLVGLELAGEREDMVNVAALRRGNPGGGNGGGFGGIVL